jgi:hypothetical protein
MSNKQTTRISDRIAAIFLLSSIVIGIYGFVFEMHLRVCQYAILVLSASATVLLLKNVFWPFSFKPILQIKNFAPNNKFQLIALLTFCVIVPTILGATSNKWCTHIFNHCPSNITVTVIGIIVALICVIIGAFIADIYRMSRGASQLA